MIPGGKLGNQFRKPLPGLPIRQNPNRAGGTQPAPREEAADCTCDAPGRGDDNERCGTEGVGLRERGPSAVAAGLRFDRDGVPPDAHDEVDRTGTTLDADRNFFSDVGGTRFSSHGLEPCDEHLVVHESPAHHAAPRALGIGASPLAREIPSAVGSRTSAGRPRALL